jgi:hypothetical protein
MIFVITLSVTTNLIMNWDELDVKLTEEYRLFGVISLCMAFMILSSISLSYAVPPSACNNRADAKILSLKIDNGTKTNVLSKHDSVIEAGIENGYSVTLLLQTYSRNSSSDEGSVWLTTTAYGFSSGMCIENVKFSGSGKGIKQVSIEGIQMGQATDGLVQGVNWGSLPDTEQVKYKVIWHHINPFD